LQSRSAHSERRSKQAELTGHGEAGRTFLDYREIYKTPRLELDTVGFGKSVHDQPTQPRQDLLLQDDIETLQMEFDRPPPAVPQKTSLLLSRQRQTLTLLMKVPGLQNN
jgi:hypothetical protein